ncbi:MAG: divergent polysaccharide deacetylase family protein [Holosporaceae bacterium]|jgi:polysaccharide deacetylase 2 family uncharacterized protein YibQ|nr:divergent polysaccharide deacetylase family protein [Holosporaceae bacterium]
MERKLLSAWCVFLATTILFVAAVEVYHRFQNERSLNYQYRIIIDKNSIVETEEKTSDDIVKKDVDSDSEFYELTKYGYLPKISKSGTGVLDKYSARLEIGSQKELRLAVLIGEGEKIDDAPNLCNQKVTFIVPHFIDHLENVVKSIREKGHEFLLQMPTQSSIPQNKRETVSPFLANAYSGDTLEKLFYLLGSTKYTLGIANVSQTLFTKSKKDMTIIGEALAKRGLVFFDLEKSNDLAKSVAEKNNLTYITAAAIFEGNDFDVSKLNNGDILAVRLEHLASLIKILPQNWRLTPISASVKNTTGR